MMAIAPMQPITLPVNPHPTTLQNKGGGRGWYVAIAKVVVVAGTVIATPDARVLAAATYSAVLITVCRCRFATHLPRRVLA